MPLDEESGDAFVKPQFVTKELNKDFNDFVTELTDKGLIS